ncbi:MAG TPA: ABC transporter substrate-binding protein [Burkholderiales bacterium]|jgi:ABC-type transport system substrate-binding protein|nr:ABC transporter substrate-binding protein [Burkholderiales bacterium]
MLSAARRALLVALVLLLGCDGAPPSGPGSASPAGAGKVLRVTFQAAETGFDPVAVSDYYSGSVIEAIYDPLLTYDYLARPAKLVPNVTEALPVVTDDGRTYTLRIRKGIHFTPDPAFKGAPRELTAADYAYSFKRFLDPRLRSPYAFLFEGKIVGLDELAAQAKKSGRFDYDARVAGLETPDRYTLRIRLKETDRNFSHVLAFPLTGAVAREVVEAYGDDTASHPVGTGPFLLKDYTRSSRIVLEANPGYRGRIWDFEPGPDPRDSELAARMKGKRLPLIQRVEVSIMEEAQSRWLAFQKQQTDMEYALAELAPNFITADGKLKPEFAARGIRLERSVDPEIIYLYFNVAERIGNQPNPVGGFGAERIALRRAIAMSYNVEDQIRIIRKGQAIRANYPIPPGVAGHDPKYTSYIPYDPRAANALLDKFGYRRGPDGYRARPDGTPLTVRYSSSSTERDRQFDELMKRSLDSIGIRLAIHKGTFSELIKLGHECRIMMKTTAWIADYPDGDNFMQLLYGPNTGQSNSACYRSPEFDRRYEKSRQLPDGPERDRLYREMTRLMEVDAVWLLTDSRYRNVLLHPHVVGFRQHPVLHHAWLYVDMEPVHRN